MTAIRLPISLSLALLMTVTLFWSLGVLTAGVRAVDPVTAVGPIEFTIHIPDDEPARIVRIRPPIPKPDLLPDRPGITVDPLHGVDPGVGPSPLDPDLFGPGDGGPLTLGDRRIPSLGGTDRNAIPQVRIAPDYPPVAKARGIEGWVTFCFSITREGRVKDIEILAADPPRIWDDATIRAVSNWRYQPKLENGVPVEQQGVTASYRFTLDR